MSDAPRVAAIIPAYNEAPRIARVLAVVCQVELLSEIIIVDDGSSDATAARVHEFAATDARIRLIRHPANTGKGQAIFTGARSTRAPVLLILDADLIGLKPAHIDALAEPVVRQEVEMSLGLFRGGHILTDFSHWAAPWLSGQRCLRAELLGRIDARAAAGYGFETALTAAAAQTGCRTRVVPMRGVWHPPSEFHREPLHAVSWRLRMYAQIARAWYLAGGWTSLKKGILKRIMFLVILLAVVPCLPEGDFPGIPGLIHIPVGWGSLSVPVEVFWS